ncbi:AAA family ATPase [Patulibacter sp.]|uniref:AAA family ATPase n=1 Tax=Patulibacter sp. TaxID=1912859 RepID=UPI00271A8A0F|nr:AAA family ATPase [Patulibacter sp.]MDO9409709.1 AAA family ATPase [Patulibacter sp.]
MASVMEDIDAALVESIPDDTERLGAIDAVLVGADVPATRYKPVDLGALMRDGVPPVEFAPGPLARGLVYASGVTGFTAHPESGKTTIVQRLALDALRAGGHVIYLDFEQGEAETVRRFSALGAVPADLDPARFVYLPFPGPVDWIALGALWDDHPGAMGVFDSTRGILRTLGLDEDRASEVGQFMDPLVEFALTREVPCLLIDHVAKAATDSTGYARGSGDKLAAVQAQWFVKRVRPFSETEAGEVELHRWKARSGGLPRVHRLGIGDGEGRLPITRLDADLSAEGKIDTAIIKFLRDHDESASLAVVEKGIEGRADTIRDRVKALAQDESRPVIAVPAGQFTRYAYDADLDHEPTAPLAF